MDNNQNMRMRAKQNLVIGFCLSLFSIVFYLFTYHFSANQLEQVQGDLGPAFFPRLFLIALLAESIFMIVSSIRKMTKTQSDEVERPKLFQGLPFVMLVLFMLYIGLSALGRLHSVHDRLSGPYLLYSRRTHTLATRDYSASLIAGYLLPVPGIAGHLPAYRLSLLEG